MQFAMPILYICRYSHGSTATIPSYRGATTLTNNTPNFDAVKLSSHATLEVGWAKRHMADFKFALIFSRLDKTGTGKDLRQPYFISVSLRKSLMP